MTTTPVINWIDDVTFEVDGHRFRSSVDPREYRTLESTSERFVLLKEIPYIRACIERLPAVEPRNIVELGIYQGGSVAFWNLLLRPDRHVALERNADRCQPLDRFIEHDGHHGRIDLAYGVDQADTDGVLAAVDGAFGDLRLDLVIDDASHMYFESRSAFETLFPRLRPDGLYIIEHWGWAHRRDMSWDDVGFAEDRPALSNLVVETCLACASTPEVVAEVRVTPDAVEIRRGPGAIAEPMALAAMYSNRGLPYRALL
jgi:hypothetical protein